ncbi:MAG: LptF/LptG family permease [Flavobacteriaceae bacterium]|nr:LptF/LptG family permease [Flavobacteriaceae bacterium]
MLTIIDKYILKRYLLTFVVMMALFVPIGIMVDLSEKVDKMNENNAPSQEIVLYYMNFIVYFANLLFPIFLFLSVIWFTSKLASNTEIVAILSSGVSFTRFLRPYIIGATILSVFVFFMGLFVVPRSSEGFNKFSYQYLYKNRKEQETVNIFNQIGDHDFIYVSSFDPKRLQGSNFTLEHFNEQDELTFKITAETIRWVEQDSVYRLLNYTKRLLHKEGGDTFVNGSRLDTVFGFKIQDLSQVSYAAETKNVFELNDFIEEQKRKGDTNISRFQLVQYRRLVLPITVFILTLIAVAVSSVKRRGGMGVNLAFGILVAFTFVFFDKIFGTLAEQSGFSPLLAVLIPNFVFGILGIYLLRNAQR